MSQIRQFSDKQLVQLIERRSPHHPKHIGYDAMFALLQGRVQLPQPLPEGELPPNHYRFRATGVLPPFARLNGELYTWASDIHNGSYVWDPHEDNAERDLGPGERVGFLKGFGVRTTTEMAVLWGREHGWWPGTNMEANDFGCAHPDLQRKNPIVAPGSSAVCGDDRCIAVLLGDGDRRDLDNDNVGGVWVPRCLFFFVRNVP